MTKSQQLKNFTFISHISPNYTHAYLLARYFCGFHFKVCVTLEVHIFYTVFIPFLKFNNSRGYMFLWKYIKINFYCLDHDQENVTQVQGYEGAGEYEAYLTYYTGWEEAIKIVDSSDECAQFMRWDCLAAIIHNPYNPDMLTTFWKNRTEQMTNYFGGATPGSGNCACGETNSCFNATLPCNCDINDDLWHYDEGFVTNKAELPIHSFFAGDTGEFHRIRS